MGTRPATLTVRVVMTAPVVENFDRNALATEMFCLRMSRQVDVDFVSANLSARIVDHVLTGVLTGTVHADARAQR